MELPKDSAILLSYINTQLRDNYPTFEELCKSLCVDADEITSKLSMLDYKYNPEHNRFE